MRIRVNKTGNRTKNRNWIHMDFDELWFDFYLVLYDSTDICLIRSRGSPLGSTVRTRQWHRMWSVISDQSRVWVAFVWRVAYVTLLNADNPSYLSWISIWVTSLATILRLSDIALHITAFRRVITEYILWLIRESLETRNELLVLLMTFVNAISGLKDQTIGIGFSVKSKNKK